MDDEGEKHQLRKIGESMLRHVCHDPVRADMDLARTELVVIGMLTDEQMATVDEHCEGGLNGDSYRVVRDFVMAGIPFEKILETLKERPMHALIYERANHFPWVGEGELTEAEISWLSLIGWIPPSPKK